MIHDVSIPAALIAGLVSFLSPCVLPLVPPYLIYLTGATIEHVANAETATASRRAVMISAVMFVLGFSTVFVALGASASLIGGLVRAWSAELSIAAGIVIIIMGLHFLGLTRIGFLMREGRLPIPKPVGLWGAYVMGLAFAFGWTPCIGPILAAILSVAAAEATVAKGAGLLAVYSAGPRHPVPARGVPGRAVLLAVLADEAASCQCRAGDGRADGDHRHRLSQRRHLRGQHLAAGDVSGAAEYRLSFADCGICRQIKGLRAATARSPVTSDHGQNIKLSFTSAQRPCWICCTWVMVLARWSVLENLVGGELKMSLNFAPDSSEFEHLLAGQVLAGLLRVKGKGFHRIVADDCLRIGLGAEHLLVARQPLFDLAGGGILIGNSKPDAA